MTSKLTILIDSATSAESNDCKYGLSTSVWAAWWVEVCGNPWKAGILFNKRQGPNKAFYEGVVAALEACFYMCHRGDTVVVYGDCETVIKHLNSEKEYREGSPLAPFYNQVKRIERELRNKRACEVSYTYVSEVHPKYKVIDRIAKEAKKFLSDRFVKI